MRSLSTTGLVFMLGDSDSELMIEPAKVAILICPDGLQYQQSVKQKVSQEDEEHKPAVHRTH